VVLPCSALKQAYQAYLRHPPDLGHYVFLYDPARFRALIGSLRASWSKTISNKSKAMWGAWRMGTNDREQVAAAWAARGFGCELWVDSPGQRWEDFTHATDELVLVLEGVMELEVEGRVVQPAIGEELLIPAGARHSARNVGSATEQWLCGYRRG
jgi:quercetin dioxygenase-like cupin family protein